MKKKFKKIMATALLSMTATSAIGCATTNTKIAQKINNGVEDFVSSINKLDYVETNNNSNSNIGKIVSAVSENNLYTKMTSNTNIENTITRPSERSDNFKLYVLSESPYITLTSDDNSLNFSMQVSTEKIETTSDDISTKINQLILKRAILMIYVNEIYNGNVNLTDENRKAINAYVNIIKENASYLNGNRGMVKNQLGMASNLINKQSEDNIINYYIIKSGEALEIRSNKIESSISAIDSIISILEQNLTQNSCYYQNNLTTSYQNMITQIENNATNSENEILAKNIAESIDMLNTNSQTTIQNGNTSTYPMNRSISQNNQKQTRSTSTQNNCIDCNKTNTKINTTNTDRNNLKNQQIQTLESHEEIQQNNELNTQNNIIYRNDTENNNKRTRNNRNRLNKTNQNTNNNPTLNVDKLSSNANLENNTRTKINNNSNIENNSYKHNSTNNNNLNRATRVPYRVSTNNNID